MKNCVLFCAAGFDRLAESIGADDFIIAADGGLAHTRTLGIEPNEIIGDFDSLGYVPRDARVFPVEKDDTDSMLAVRRGLGLGFRRFVIYGGMDGKRLDHTIANFQTLQFLADRDAVGYLVGRDYIACVIRDSKLIFPEGTTGDVSVFCLGPDAEGVDLEGVYYTLRGGTLTSGFPLGVSNHFTGSAASVSVQHGSLLVLWDRSAGLAETQKL